VRVVVGYNMDRLFVVVHHFIGRLDGSMEITHMGGAGWFNTRKKCFILHIHSIPPLAVTP
jgi:hypothetical protein